MSEAISEDEQRRAVAAVTRARAVLMPPAVLRNAVPAEGGARTQEIQRRADESPTGKPEREAATRFSLFAKTVEEAVGMTFPLEVRVYRKTPAAGSAAASAPQPTIIVDTDTAAVVDCMNATSVSTDEIAGRRLPLALCGARCHFCKSPITGTAYACSGCSHFARYCSEDHASKAWAAGHRAACPLIRRAVDSRGETK